MADSIVYATRRTAGSAICARPEQAATEPLHAAGAVAHRSFRIGRPLARQITQRLEMLLVMQMVFLAQLQFLRNRITPVLAPRVTEVMGETVQRRRVLIDDATAALRPWSEPRPCRYPADPHAGADWLGLQPEPYIAFRNEALLSNELFEHIRRTIEARRDAVGRMITFDLQAGLERRLRHSTVSTLPERVVSHHVV